MGIMFLSSPQRLSGLPVEPRVVQAGAGSCNTSIWPATFFHGRWDPAVLCVPERQNTSCRVREPCCARAALATSAAQGGVGLVSRCLLNVHGAITELGAAIKPFPIRRYRAGNGPCAARVGPPRLRLQF